MKKDCSEKWQLRLFVAGMNPAAERALVNLKEICDQRLKDGYHVEIIDILKSPQLAEDYQIFAVPTVVRCLPAPARKIVGDLSDTRMAVLGLEL